MPDTPLPAPTSGHLFVVRGDLTALACDAVLVPSDARLSVKRNWLDAYRSDLGRHADTAGFLNLDRPDGWGDDGQRTLRFDGDPDLPTRWLTNVGGTQATDPTWFATGALAFLDAASAALEGQLPQHNRSRPLLALPLVGTSTGVGRTPGGVTAELVTALAGWAARNGMDVALVANDDRAYAAVQAVRADQLGADDGDVATLAAAWQVTPELYVHAQRLGRLALEGRLAVFFGAGLGAGAGTRPWRELLAGLARDAGIATDAFRRLDVQDQAELLAIRLQDTTLGAAVAAEVGKLHVPGLAHSLLAALPVREFVTTTLDRLFQVAAEAAGAPLAALPFEHVGASGRFVLKLYGGVEEPESMVLTRRDLLRYEAHRAMLQALLQTQLVDQHLVFLGYAPDSASFHRISDEIRRVRSEGTPPPTSGSWGTVVELVPDALMDTLWGDDLDRVTLLAEGESGGVPRANRRLELFCDLLAFHAVDPSSFLLDADAADLLGAEESSLASALGALASADPDRLATSPAWAPVRDLLGRYR